MSLFIFPYFLFVIFSSHISPIFRYPIFNLVFFFMFWGLPDFMEDNTWFAVVIHWKDYVFILKRFIIDYLCYMELLSQVQLSWRLDCEKKSWLEGQLLRDWRIVNQDDQALLTWIKENGYEGNDTLHLFVEALNHAMEPLLEESKVYLSNPNIVNTKDTDQMMKWMKFFMLVVWDR